MTDKVQKIREEVVRLRNLHQIKYQQIDTNDNMCLVECGKRNLCNELLSFIDSLQEEPVSDDLVEAALIHYKDVMEYEAKTGMKPAYMTSFKAGAKWQMEQMMSKAVDGTARPDDNEIWCNLTSNNLEDGDKVKVILIKEG